MSVELYHHLLDRGIRLYAKDDKLVWEAPQGAVTEALLAELRAHKQELLELLRIGRADRSQPLPLSYAQERLWFLAQLGYAEHYHIPHVVRSSAALDEPALQSALDMLVARHEILRTRFVARGGQASQLVEPSAELRLECHDLRRLAPEERQRAARRLIEQIGSRPFDLGQAPLMRAALVRLEPQQHLFAFCLHHIVSDGWSTALVLRELGQAYAACVRGDGRPLPALALQYGDYAAWQRALFTEQGLAKQLAYWKDQLAGYQDLDLPTDRPRPRQLSGRGGHVYALLASAAAERLRQSCQRHQLTPSALLAGSVYVLLERYGGQRDICLGLPVANRNHSATHDLIGLFVNTVVLRVRGRDLEAAGFLARVQQLVSSATDHQDVPFEKVVEALQPRRDLARNPLFQVLVSYGLGQATEPVLFGDVRVEQADLRYDVSKFDLGFFCSDGADGGLRVAVEYSDDLYDRSTAERLAGHLLHVMKSLAEHPERAQTLELLGPEERHEVLALGQGPRVAYPRGQSIHGLFEHQVQRTPEAIALRCGDSLSTYAELNARANRLAHWLRGRGVGPEVCVAICLERTPELPVTLLAVLKAGATYVPLDPAYPAERLAFLLHDSQARLLITQQALLGRLPGDAGAELLTLEALQPLLAQQPADDPAHVGHEHNAAYVIYTSGSTGVPKGVVIEHASAVVLLHWARDTFGSDGLASVLASTSVCFDLSIFELFAPLAWGGTVVLVKNALELGLAAAQGAVGLVNSVPSVMAEVLRQGGLPGCVHTVNLAGEPLAPALVDQLYAQPHVRRVFDLYGPSEDTTYSTFVLRQPGQPASIGRPLANTRAYVLDARQRLVPVGVPGELYLGGAGLARGYLGRPELTAERFLEHALADAPDERLYRTGDLVRWRADGNLEYLGRKDQQVKVRGFRIELGEVEAALRQVPGVADAVAAVHDDPTLGARLVGYIVPGDGQAPHPRELREVLERRLPQHLVPALFVSIGAVPLTPNGKVDRRALPDPGTPESGLGFVAPRTADEQLLAGIWCELLGLERVGVHDNFFELGGHSLLVARVLARAQEALRMPLPMRAFFEHPTVAGLARLVCQVDGVTSGAALGPMLRARPRAAELPLSLTEQDFWLGCQMNPLMRAYNTGSAVRLLGPLDVAALERSLEDLAQRHEILRTTYRAEDGRTRRAIAARATHVLEQVDLRATPLEQREEQARRLATEQRKRPFDLTEGPLLRPTLLILADDDHVLLLTLHHVAADAWSMGLMARDLGALYAARRGGVPAALPALELQYADYAAWQRECLQAEALAETLTFWRTQLAGLTERLPLPKDGPGGPPGPVRASSTTCIVPRADLERLKALGQRQGTTPFMVLLALFELVLFRRSGRADVVVAVPSSERRRTELESMLGVFLNLVVLRTDLAGEPSFLDLLQRVRATCEAAYGRPGVSFGTVMQAVARVLDLTRVPLNQIMFNFINVPDSVWELPELVAEPFRFDHEPPLSSELTLSLLDRADGLYCHLFYNGQAFSARSMNELLAGFAALATQVVEAPDRSIGAYVVPVTPGADDSASATCAPSVAP